MRATSILLLCGLLTAPVSADNWPAWRGPRDAGVSAEKNLPVSWSDTDNVAWAAPLRGLGVSSPIVWSDRVFVTSQPSGSEKWGRESFFEDSRANKGLVLEK